MMIFSIEFLGQKKTWKEGRKSEGKQEQTTKEIKKKKLFGFFLFTLTTEFGSSSLALDLLSKVEQI